MSNLSEESMRELRESGFKINEYVMGRIRLVDISELSESQAETLKKIRVYAAGYRWYEFDFVYSDREKRIVNKDIQWTGCFPGYKNGGCPDMILGYCRYKLSPEGNLYVC